jgi:hypothetical protein
MSLTIVSWCGGDPCDPCKKPPPNPLPPKVGGGPWLPTLPSTAFRVWFYLVQDHFTNSVLDGGETLDGIGAIIYTPTFNTGFSWEYGPIDPAAEDSVNGYGGPHIVIVLDYFDGGLNTAQVDAQYGSVEDAQAIGEVFNQYYYGL